MAELKKYNEKRNFEKTKEPTGEVKTSKAKKKLHYVIQHHLARRDHYDFRLEWNGSLLSWAVPKGPSLNPDDKRLAVEVEHHPYDYKDFEGIIPKGEYGGGTVMLWDEGYFEPLTDFDKGLIDGSLKFILYGKRLKGRWALVRLAKKEGEDQDNWLLIKDKDEYAKDESGIAKFSTSVRTGLTMGGIEKGEKESLQKNPVGSADLQLAKLVSSVPVEKDWLYEIKYDGYRIAAYAEENQVRLITRNGKDFTRHFKDIEASLITLANGRAMILDGEMVIIDDKGKTDFQALQNYMKNPDKRELTYVVFDILALNGEDLRDEKLVDRKNTLKKIMKNAPENLYYSKHIKGRGEDFFESACELDLEGIIGKKANSKYSGTRNGEWIKLKCDRRQEFIIGGYTLSDKQSSGLSSVLVGFYEGGKLNYAGRAGTGFSEKDRKELSKKFNKYIIKDCPFLSVEDKRSNEEVFWLKPEMVAEIKFAEWTDDNLLRQASFKGLRLDKNANEVKNEYYSDSEDGDLEIGQETKKSKAQSPKLSANSNSKPINNSNKQSASQSKNQPKKKDFVKLNDDEIEIGGIRITSPEKVIFQNPEIKKIEVVEYYSKVAERMLMYAGDRILSTVRCPKGVNEPCFFKKHPGLGSKNIVITPIATQSGKEEYFYIEEPKGFIYEAQMGTLEFHTWGSKIDNLEKPDMMVFDLDPDEGMAIEKVRQGVRDMKSILEQLSLTCFLKVSGGKGYHVVVPFTPSADWDTFSSFAKSVANLMENTWPDRYTSNMRKSKREGKIFIDWVRNGRGATSIAPFSIRAREGAKVALPIAWKELDTVLPNGITMQEAISRLKKSDPWKDFFKVEQSFKVNL
ncbi:MAG TPA: DNA ligase D [Clostridia bacterium]|nr:DNA ligase D [Clostridia bacterium]